MFLLATILISSCTKDSFTNNYTSQLPIAWDIVCDDYSNTKSLINDYTSLKNACTQSEGNYEKIGLYGNCFFNGTDFTVFNNHDLWWWIKENGNPFNDEIGNPSNWNYNGEDKFWQEGADYHFKAYYPKSKVTLQPGSGVEQFLVVYDSQKEQYDLMVADKQLKSGEENPVKLLFKHTLAALRFDFKFTDIGITDKLNACWLENAQPNGFYTSSTLNYNKAIYWPQSTANIIGDKMYYWEPINPIQIESEKAAIGYSTAALTDKGSLYTENDGWVLVIPQTTKGPESLKLCFTTNTGGNEVYRVGLPATTLEPGNRYTYHIKISSTSIDVNLSIKEWNERKSSYDIDFNNN